MKDHETGESECICGEWVFTDGHCLCETIAELRDRLTRMEDRCREVIEAVETDERYHYTSAQVQTNAPLALVQVSLNNRIGVARYILAAAREEE